MSKLLLIADPHLTSRPQDDYRWQLFDECKKLIALYGIHSIALLGDLTEFKDNHPSKLVNRLVDELQSLCEHLEGCLFLLRGNHDGNDADWPFFRFTQHLTGVIYIAQPDVMMDGPFDRPLVFLPHTPNPLEDWDPKLVEDAIVFTHVTVDGAFSETSAYQLKNELPSSFFDKAKLAFSGDIHKPQQCGNLTYVGCPYNVRFGDNFDGGVIVLDTETCEWERVPLTFPRKLTIDAHYAEDVQARLRGFEHEQIEQAFVKVRLHLNEQNVAQRWEIRKKCIEAVNDAGYTLSAVELVNECHGQDRDFDQVLATIQAKFSGFDDFCKNRNVPEDLIGVGREIMELVP